MSDAVTRLNAALEGRYAIERELGEGGMATVYLADDLKHERKVALKVLKPELAAVVGAERFLAEIKTTANLQHPHILPLFDSGEADSFLFYVMPFVEGESLRDRIDREHQLPVDEAVKIATDLAEALDYAHRHKIIHRDIKPANILIHEGRPLIADFGIALAVGVAGGGRLTETGLSVGTPHYMSPEQATGDQAVGVATDIYALGAVLYEMLIGEPPYTGSTAQAILGKIIQGKTASASEERASVPRNVDAAIRKALEKLPADRFTGAQQFARALSDPGFRHGEVAVGGLVVAGGAWNRLSIATTTIAVVASAVAGWSLMRPEPPVPIERFESPFREGQAPTLYGTERFALSPDGSRLVYVGPGGLWVRRWDDPDASLIRGTEGGSRPSVSPDGAQLVFQQSQEIKVLSFEGGPIQSVTAGRWPLWGGDGYLYFDGSSFAERIPVTGGQAEPVRVDGRVHEVLSGGSGALVTSGGEIGTLRIATGETTRLFEGNFPRYAVSGHLVYLAPDLTLMAARFDADAMELLGQPVPLLADVDAYDISDTGKLFYSKTPGGARAEFVWLTRSGQATPVEAGWTFDRGAVNPGWSLAPDGARLAWPDRSPQSLASEAPLRFRACSADPDSRVHVTVNNNRGASVFLSLLSSLSAFTQI